MWWYLRAIKEGSYVITVVAEAENAEKTEEGILVTVTPKR